MRIAAGTPPLGIEVAVALLAGVGGCLLLPWLPPWPMLVVLLFAAVAAWWRYGNWRRFAGAVMFWPACMLPSRLRASCRLIGNSTMPW
jgi:hypothetical protein